MDSFLKKHWLILMVYLVPAITFNWLILSSDSTEIYKNTTNLSYEYGFESFELWIKFWATFIKDLLWFG